MLLQFYWQFAIQYLYNIAIYKISRLPQCGWKNLDTIIMITIEQPVIHIFCDNTKPSILRTNGYRDTAMTLSASDKLRARKISYLALKSPQSTPT